jgi:hypothetical protein
VRYHSQHLQPKYHPVWTDPLSLWPIFRWSRPSSPPLLSWNHNAGFLISFPIQPSFLGEAATQFSFRRLTPLLTNLWLQRAGRRGQVPAGSRRHRLQVSARPCYLVATILSLRYCARAGPPYSPPGVPNQASLGLRGPSPLPSRRLFWRPFLVGASFTFAVAMEAISACLGKR